jgi:ribosomal protein RSM22 (predicted rRNA methylase)
MRPTSEIIASEGLTQTEYDQIAANPQFQRYVDTYKAELKENGFSFSAKSRVLAEDLLPSAYHMARDPDVPAAVRAKILENLVDWGDLKPKNSANVGAGPGFSITINIPNVGQTPAQTIVLEAENAENPQKTSKFDEDEIKMLGLPRKQEISLAEGDDYVYAGDDYL